MSVGIVIVSHSAKIAEGTRDLAVQMADDVVIECAGGTSEGGLGTDFDAIDAAVSRADSGSGVVIITDLGSSTMTAELVRESRPDSATIAIPDAAIVEGTVAAAVAAQTGGDVQMVSRAAETSIHRSRESASGESDVPVSGWPGSGEQERSGAPAQIEPVFRAEVALVNPEGLHARPAAEFVRVARAFDAEVRVNGANAASLLEIMALGLLRGRTITIEASGPQADEAGQRLVALVESGFGDRG